MVEELAAAVLKYTPKPSIFVPSLRKSPASLFRGTWPGFAMRKEIRQPTVRVNGAEG